jgi:hypothetical protein
MKTTIDCTTHHDGACRKNDVDWINLKKDSDNNKPQEQEEDEEGVVEDLSHLVDEKHETDFVVKLRDSSSMWYGSALRIRSDQLQQERPIDSYKRDLLLDNPNFLQHSNVCCDGDVDDLIDFDLDDDMDLDDDEIHLWTNVVEYQMPLSDGNKPPLSSSVFSSFRNNSDYITGREAWWDRCYCEVNRLKEHLHFPENRHDDQLSRGDLESCWYDDREGDSEDNDDDDEEDCTSISSNSDGSAVYHLVGKQSYE